MESNEGGVSEIDRLEKGLLSDTREGNDCEDEDEEPILFSASFEEAEDDFIKLKTTQWILYSLLLILAWGFGFIMFLYIPVRRCILRRMMRSRKLYVTPNAIVYKQVTKPVPFPCFGVLKKEKHVLLPSVADVVIEQGYLQSHYGVYSIRIENVGVRRPPSDDVQIEGIANPQAFRKVVMMRLSKMRNQAYSRQASIPEDFGSPRNVQSYNAPMSPSKSLAHDTLSHVGEVAILQKLEEVGNSLKRVQTLIEEQQPKISEYKD
ncbi:uncharacterized protein LOC112500193 isoform X1 [Cynara cardunculus var. scolymus]|uniref:uncharacterized protein LOC112500193 isoform X1 n=1 Tax=Cynara cardunculus var. scolymus TaxID=59895 RepID=UPI000D62D070|nr:uncharacterized protein LOC112500193 isoform X1 [Cynara cardunculus var. scolymus]